MGCIPEECRGVRTQTEMHVMAGYSTDSAGDKLVVQRNSITSEGTELQTTTPDQPFLVILEPSAKILIRVLSGGKRKKTAHELGADVRTRVQDKGCAQRKALRRLSAR
jgi:hypothetical protein